MNPYLTHLLTLSNAATEGPWLTEDQGPHEGWYVTTDDGEQVIVRGCWPHGDQERQDAAFIAEARTAVPRLVEMVREAVEGLEAMRGALNANHRPSVLEMSIASIARRTLARVEQLAKGAQP